MPSTLEQKAAYVAGFMDGEGHICYKRTKAGFWTCGISFCNTDATLVVGMKQKLHDLGFKTRTQFSQSKNQKWASRWTVYIAGGAPAFAKFKELISIQSPAKVAVLDKIVAHPALVAENRKLNRLKHVYPCEQCAKPLRATPAFRKRGGGRFCSIECRGVSERSEPVVFQCPVCNKATPMKPFVASKRKYCSMACAQSANLKNLRSRAAAAANARWNKERAVA